MAKMRNPMIWKGEQMGKEVLETHSWGEWGVGGSFEDPEGMSALKDNLIFGGEGRREAEG